MMTKKKLEKKLTRKIKAIRKIWFKYLDSIPEEGNEVAKEKKYLDITIFDDSYGFYSFVDETEMRKEHQIYVYNIEE